MLVKIEQRAFREAGVFVRVDGEMRRLPSYFDKPVTSKYYGIFLVHLQEPWQFLKLVVIYARSK